MLRGFHKFTTITVVTLLSLGLGAGCAPTQKAVYYDAIVIEEKQLPDSTYEYAVFLPDNSKIIIKHKHTISCKAKAETKTKVDSSLQTRKKDKSS